MNKTYLLWLLITISLSSYAQTITIKDFETGNPLESVTLSSEAPKAFTVTDAKGQANLEAFKGAEKIEIRLLGFNTQVKSYKELAKNGYVVRLVLTGFSLNEIVISANRFEEKQDRVVQKIQVLRNSELQQMNQTSTADVIANSGNIMVQKSQLGGGSPIIRGFEANKVLMVVDGVRLNNAIYRGGHLQNILTLDNSVMERVELVFGPGSVIYGSDALGGVMHFYTKNPVLSDSTGVVVKGNAFTRYFSAAQGYANHANISIGGKKFGSLTSFTHSKYDDLRQGNIRNPFYGNFGERSWYVKRINGVDSTVVNNNKNIQVGSGYSQMDLLQKFMFKQSDKVFHLFNFQYSTSSDIPRYDRLTQLSGSNPKFAEWYYGPQKRLFASYNLSLENNNALYDKAQFILGYQNVEESRNTRRFRNDNLDKQIEQLDIITLNADFDKMISNHDIRYGFDGWFNKVYSKAYSLNILDNTSGSSATRYPDGGSTMHSLALYLTHSWEISEKVILNEGVRVTNIGLSSKFNDKTFFPFPFNEVNQNNTAVNGNIGIILKPFETWRVTLNFASGFRAPNVDDMSKVFESVQGSIILPNPNLKPEYTYTGELGIEKTFAKSVTVSTVGYYTLYNNALTVQPVPFNGQNEIMYDGQISRVTSTVNAGEAYLYGIESKLLGNLNEYLSFIGTFNYTYGRIKTDSLDYPLDHIPPVFGKVGINISKNKFRNELFVNYSGWKRLKDYNTLGEDNIEYATIHGMPAWYTLNARITYQVIKPMSIQAALENILDQNYRVFASNISAPGRNLILTARYNF